MRAVMRLVLVALALVGATLPAAAQRPAPSLCVRAPSFPGCLPAPPSVSLQSILPLAVGNTVYGASVSQLLSMLTDAGGLTSATAATTFFPSRVVGPGNAASLQAANTAATAANGQVITLKPGSYPLTGVVYSDLINTWMFQTGVNLSGGGQIDAVVDNAVLSQAGFGLARLLGGSGASHVMTIQGRAIPLTSPPASTESTGLLISLVNNRPSSYTGTVRLHDVVNLELQQTVESGITSARVHGLSVGVGPGEGADAYVSAVESTVINGSGTDAGTLGTINSKLAYHAVAFGNAASTAALVTSAGSEGTMPNAKFLDGLVVVQQSLVTKGHALSVRPISYPGALTTREDDVAYIDRDGSAMFGTIKTNGQAALQSLIVSGGGVFQSTMTVGGVGAIWGGLTLASDDKPYLFWDGATARLKYAYNGTTLWSVDTSGNMRVSGTVTGSTAPRRRRLGRRTDRAPARRRLLLAA